MAIKIRDESGSALLRHSSAESGKVKWRDVAMFSFFAYVIAWPMWATLLPAIGFSLSTGRTPAAFGAGALVMLGMFGPALAALVMRAFVSREGFRESLGPSRGWRFYVIALLGPPVLVFVLVGAVVVLGLGQFSPGMPLGTLFVVLLLVGTPIGALLAFGEEYGWRGYLLPKLLPLGEVRASLVVALTWGPWHLPVLLAGLNYPGQGLPAVLVVFLLSVAALSLLQTRLFVASGGSVLAVALLHGSLNTFSDRLTNSEHLVGNPLIVSGGGLLLTTIVAVMMLLAYGARKHPRRASQSFGRADIGGDGPARNGVVWNSVRRNGS
jgi:membrane protease YdiL (CAAX protease family)